MVQQEDIQILEAKREIERILGTIKPIKLSCVNLIYIMNPQKN